MTRQEHIKKIIKKEDCSEIKAKRILKKELKNFCNWSFHYAGERYE